MLRKNKNTIYKPRQAEHHTQAETEKNDYKQFFKVFFQDGSLNDDDDLWVHFVGDATVRHWDTQSESEIFRRMPLRRFCNKDVL